MNTQEQAARNAEIVQRRLAGEHTGDLALEYGVTATRIGQLMRRHREKAGEIPAKPRTKAPAKHAKKPTQRIRPRLRKDELGLWECFDAGMSRRGETPREAYDRWQNASLVGLFEKELAPCVAKVAKEPEQPYRGPVTVVPGVRPGQALRLPQSLLLNGARARAAQPYTPSLSGGRRGGT